MIRDLVAVLGPAHRRTASATFAWLVVAGLTQGLAVSTLVPVLRAVLSGDRGGAGRWLMVLLALVAAAVVTHWVASMRGFDLALTVLRELGARFGDRLSTLPVGWFDAGSAGRLSRIGTTGLQSSVSSIAHLIQPAIYGVTVPAVVGVVVLVVDWRLGLVLVVASPVLWLCFRYAARMLGRSDELAHVAGARASSAVLEFADCQPVLRAFGRTGAASYQPLEDAIHAQQQAGRRQLWMTVPGMLLTGVALQVAFTALVVLGLVLVDRDAVDAVALVALLALLARFLGPLALVSELSGGIRMARNDIARIRAVLDAPELPSPTAPVDLPTPGAVELREVTFAYVDGSPALQRVSLSAEPHRITAVVGPSGAGKSTVARLVARFWDTGTGQVLVGGVDVRDQPLEQLMSQVAVVFQDVYLFDETLRENVLIGRLGAADTELDEAARLSGVDEIVARLPDGWATRVGEGGARLSGGERQRVSIARALLKRAPVVLLDEATSALDAEHEALVRRSVTELARTSTVLVVAHTPAMISLADHVVVLEDGMVAETGAPGELLDAGGVFARLWGERRSAASWRLGATG